MKRGLMLVPFVMGKIMEVDVSQVDSWAPLFYAYGELSARFKIKSHYEDLKDIGGAYGEMYRGYKEYKPKKQKDQE